MATAVTCGVGGIVFAALKEPCTTEQAGQRWVGAKYGGGKYYSKYRIGGASAEVRHKAGDQAPVGAHHQHLVQAMAGRWEGKRREQEGSHHDVQYGPASQGGRWGLGQAGPGWMLCAGTSEQQEQT